MKCFYINLDAAADRRQALERNFAETAPASWSLHRVAAAGPQDVHDTPGQCTAAEKGCFASHIRALEACLGEPDDALIVEDDEAFTPHSFGLIEKILAETAGWDVLFTDLALVEPSTMLRYGRLWGQLAAVRQIRLEDLSNIPFAGSSAYLVRDAAKRRLLDLLRAVEVMDTPVDLTLQKLAHDRQLAARMCFPFVTTLGPLANTTQIQDGGDAVRDRTFNAFRRLMFVDRDIDACSAEVAELAAGMDESARLLGVVYGNLVSGRIVWS